MNLWGILGAIVIAVLLTVPELARGEDARCSQVRAGVAKYGQAVAIRWARANGYSAAQIKQARKCLVIQEAAAERRAANEPARRSSIRRGARHAQKDAGAERRTGEAKKAPP